jgi:pimeloyl-ACP methyl ester carboxylesterase
MVRVESLLAARLFLQPQVVGDRIYFLSNLDGKISLYAMDHGGSVPEPLLPPHIAIQNPHLVGGKSFYVFPMLGKIVVNLDNDGDENYQPMAIPIEGGFPEPAFGDTFAKLRMHIGPCDADSNILMLMGDHRETGVNYAYRANLETGEVAELAHSEWGAFVAAVSDDHRKAAIIESFTNGDHILRLWTKGEDGLRLIYGKPLEDRADGEQVPLNSLSVAEFVNGDQDLLAHCSIFDDAYGIAFIDLTQTQAAKPIAIDGLAHRGQGEFNQLERAEGNRFILGYNIDGVDWVYEAQFDASKLSMKVTHVLVGEGETANGVLEALYYDKAGDRYSLAHSTATSPTQILTIEGKDRQTHIRHTNERLLGLPVEHLSPGEDASYESHDGLRISARLYLPAEALGYKGPRPLVYYVHGGPQSQERPDFAWFSMPLIQLLTLRGFAVFVPNVRGSSGYGLDYMKRVDRDWGGLDRLDHVHAMTEVLTMDSRLDVKRAGVVGRSYGGYMTLMLAGRHSDLWQGAVDMFGPYDLITFSERIPASWKPYYKLVIGDPEDAEDRKLLVERSPNTFLGDMECPMLVIQGANDPRVVAAESADLVNELKADGKDIELLLFEDEGHDVLKYKNRVACYNAIVDFFAEKLAV